MAAGETAPQRPALTDEVVLADELVEAARSHPRGQRLALGRWLEQRLGTGAACPGTSGRHAASLDAIEGTNR
jgi:hypothetical protein